MSMRCDMCGSENDLVRAEIEGATMNVCRGCGTYGKILAPIKKPKKEEVIVKKEVPKRNEIITMIKPNYSSLIKSKRESKGLKQEELAQKIAEKVSVIHNLETGHIEPSIDLARKLERFLGISIVEQYEEKGTDSKTKDSALTIGDMIKVK